MANYTQISLADAQAIFDLYSLGKVKQLTALSSGISNSNYKVSTERQQFVLKVSNDKDVPQMEAEMKILNYLKENLFLFSLKPYQMKDLKFVYQWQQLHGGIFPFVEGEIPQIGAATSLEIGKSLGKLHRVSDQKKLPPFLRPHNQVGFGTEEIAQYVLSTQCPADFKQHFHKVFPQGIVELSGQDFPHGLIHGDFYFDNAIFRNGFLASMLDFEQSGIGPFIFDIGVSISGSCLKESKIFMPYVQNFIDGYHSERKLLEKELIHLNKFICLGLFSIALWRIKRFTEGILDPTKKDSYKELTTRALNFKTS